MRQLEAMYAWCPGTDRVEVGPWPDRTGWSDAYRMTGGACYTAYHKMPEDRRLMMLFVDFNTCVVRDKVRAEAVHREFLKIDEYRSRISPDTPGADQ